MTRNTKPKPVQVSVHESVFIKPFKDWFLSKEVFDQNMYPVLEKNAMVCPEYVMLLSNKYIGGYCAAVCLNFALQNVYSQKFRRRVLMHHKPSVKEKTVKEKQEPLFSEEMLRGYSETYHIDYKSVLEAVERFPEEMKIELKEYKHDFVDIAADDVDDEKIYE